LPLLDFSRIKTDYIILFATIAICVIASMLLLPIAKRSNGYAKK
jgi:hypothetical protein